MIKDNPDTEKFFSAMMDKFYRKQREHRRSSMPWSEYGYEFLLNRLVEEIKELMEETPIIGTIMTLMELSDFKITDEAADELLDVANFCMFLWLKYKIGKRET